MDIRGKRTGQFHTRSQSAEAQNLSQHRNDGIRTNRTGFTVDVVHDEHLNIPMQELRKKSGFLLFDSPTGRRLTYDFHVFLGDILKNKSYFYIVRSDAAGIDPLDHKGKVKLGYSAAKSQSAGFAMRIEHYRQWWGDSAMLHMLIVFDKEPSSRAHDFETAVKGKLKHSIENSSNIQYGQLVRRDDKQHEFFRYAQLQEVMDAARETHLQRDMQGNFVRPRGFVRRDVRYRGGAPRAWTM